MGDGVNVLKLILLACLFNQIYCYTSRYAGPNVARTLRCNNGQYVAVSDLCDDIQDCTDGSDEPSSCKTSWNCGPGQFSCIPYSNSTTNATTTAKCLNAKVLCDTRKDCANNFDEENCGDATSVQNCQLGDGKFLCSDKLRCLSIENTCDGSCNCLDCSDENENCTKIDYQSLNKCPHAYYPLPLSSGPICFCNSSNSALQNLCKEVKDCTSENRCDQQCSKYKNRILCSCFENYTEVAVSNGFKCRSKQYYGTVLIYSTANQIKYLNATTKRTMVIKKDVQTQILASSSDAVYYTTYRDMSKSIYRSSNKWLYTGEPEKILDSNSPITSIAVDYITDNFYFTTNESLSVCSKKAEICQQLICCNVSYVVLNPKNGSMFYTKKSDKPNERLLMKSSMDGSRESVFIDGSFSNIVPVAVDEEFYRLYWLEGSRLHSISLHDKTIEKRDIKFNPTLRSLAILDEIIFYSTQRDNKIYLEENLERFVKPADEKNERGYAYYDRRPQDENYTLYTDTEATISIVDIKAYNSIRQKAAQAKNPCTSSCKGLCLLRAPSYSYYWYYSSQLLTNCTCDDFSPSKDNQWCGSSSIQINPTPNDADGDDDGFPFMMTLLILIVLAAVLGGMYFIYDKYYRGVFYNSRRSQDDRIYDPNQDEF
ncbi:low-density lipoprotein receptor-related protein 8-like [Planococcus citri]|uniref:low-density lipoprotein receptor-related protein 8-like n=1 Tax=Planococcus citri TaxID=170843 RepID=UPI0031F96FA0